MNHVGRFNKAYSLPTYDSGAVVENDYHRQLARNLSVMGMGLPYRDELVDILKATLSEQEAEVAAMLPTDTPPLKPVTIEKLSGSGGMERKCLADILERLAEKGLIYSGRTESGDVGYALHQAGFGFPQAFFWRGEQAPYAREMTKLVLKYFNRKVTAETFGGQKTKPYRYIPIKRSLKPDQQAILPHDMMDSVLDGADRFAVAHCPCRVEASLVGRACGHPLEVCLKFDEMADYLIDRGLGREIDREEARETIRKAAGDGLVHFVDNTAGKVKHNCNCCGCACWNVGSIRRRKIPRDELMAVYFIRETDPDHCVGCGECMEICPVQAIELDDGVAKVDEEWCIGCGVCDTRCEYDALRIRYRKDREEIPADFETLQRKIRAHRGL